MLRSILIHIGAIIIAAMAVSEIIFFIHQLITNNHK